MEAITSINMSYNSSSTLPESDDCRICWSKINGEGFHIQSTVSTRMGSLTYADMFLHVSEMEPVDAPESLCWGCSKVLTTVYKMMKKVEEKEKIVRKTKSQPVRQKLVRKKSEVDESPDTKPSVFEMVVIKVEPQDYSDVENSEPEMIDMVTEDYSPDESDEDYEEPEEEEEKVKKERKPKSSKKSSSNTSTTNVQYKFLIQCALCIYNTREKKNYRNHVLNHHGNQELKCDGCDKEFIYIYDLEAHRKDKHNAKEKYVIKPTPISVKAHLENFDERKVVVKQEISNIFGTDGGALGSTPEEKQYKLDCLGRKIPINRNYKKGEVKWPRKERKLPINCPLCPYTGIGKSNFRNHYRRKHNKQELQCDGCEAKFHLFYRLNRHREEEHNFTHEYTVDDSLKTTVEYPTTPMVKKEKKVCHCTICDITIVGARNYHIHMKRAHNFVKPRAERVKEICSYCGKFVNNLEAHIRHLHPEQRDPYICHHCDAQLKSKSHLLRHLQSAHKLGLSQRGEPCGLMCRYCTEVFPTKHRRIAHEVRHHTFEYKFKCSICESKFLVKSDFTKHLNRHAKGKIKQARLNCQFCGEFFSRKKILAEHLNVHINQVPAFSDNLAQNLAYIGTLKQEQPN